MSGGNNSFDHMRLLMAATVVLLHISVLSANPDLSALPDILGPMNAVHAFFVASGYLVTASLLNSRSTRIYFSKRARRILPAYVAVVVITALLLAPPVKTEWWAYMAAQLSFMNFLAPTFPGAFEGNPIEVINGSLWSIKVEVAFYLMLPLIVRAISKWGPEKVLGSLYLLSVTYEVVTADMGSIGVQFPAHLSYFVAGVWWFYRREALSPKRHIVAIGFAIYAASWFAGFTWALPMGLAMIILPLCLARSPLPPLRRDLSYGLYLAHYPIIQGLVSVGVTDALSLMAAAFAFSIAAAWLLSILIERPALSLRLSFPRARQPIS